MFDDYTRASSSTEPEVVVKAIIEVMRELGPIPKGDTAPASMGNYSFRGIESIMARLGPLLAKHGVVIVPHSRVLGTEAAPSMPNGWVDVTLSVEWRVYGPDGSWISASTNGVGRDKNDKGANKAMTQAYKYLLMELFAIGDGEADSDGHAYEPHVDTPQIIDKDQQDHLLQRVAGLNDDNKKLMVAWFHEHECPPIRRLPVDRVEEVQAVIEHFENLEDVEMHEREEI